MKKIRDGIFIAIGVFALLVFFFSNDTKEATNLNIINVSDYDFTIANKAAVSIKFGKSTKEWFDITIPKTFVKENAIAFKSSSRPTNLISMDGYWDNGDYYKVLTNTSEPFVKLQFTSLDYTHNKAIVDVEARLISVKSKEILSIPKQTFIISGTQFSNLTK